MQTKKIFGTDGVRGKANVHPMTSEMALALGKAIAVLFKDKGLAHHRKVVIGKDTRRSSYMFENALSSGICSAGADAILLGPLPTPAIAFITRAMRADAGVVISASHNSFEDNGIKFFDEKGFKLPDHVEHKLEELVFSNLSEKSLCTGANIGKAFRVEDAPGRYIEFLKSTFPKELNLEGIKIVIDCAHGAAYKVAPIVLEELGAEVVPIHVHPNGTNINDDCGAVHPHKMKEALKRHQADFGIALDGDADRLVLCDEKGEIFNGDHLIALIALALKEQNKLHPSEIVATVMSNYGLENFLKEQKIGLHRTQVGDRYVVDALAEKKLYFGGENSGHLVFLEHSSTGDGLLAALQVLAFLLKKQKKLSDYQNIFELSPQILINQKVKEKKAFDSCPSLFKKMREVEKNLEGKGRLLMRYSGTEALLRIMIEGPNHDQIKAMAEDLQAESLLALGS